MIAITIFPPLTPINSRDTLEAYIGTRRRVHRSLADVNEFHRSREIKKCDLVIRGKKERASDFLIHVACKWVQNVSPSSVIMRHQSESVHLNPFRFSQVTRIDALFIFLSISFLRLSVLESEWKRGKAPAGHRRVEISTDFVSTPMLGMRVRR